METDAVVRGLKKLGTVSRFYEECFPDRERFE
jgi:hypothetical protein